MPRPQGSASTFFGHNSRNEIFPQPSKHQFSWLDTHSAVKSITFAFVVISAGVLTMYTHLHSLITFGTVQNNTSSDIRLYRIILDVGFVVNFELAVLDLGAVDVFALESLRWGWRGRAGWRAVRFALLQERRRLLIVQFLLTRRQTQRHPLLQKRTTQQD